jgi:spore germination protein YaaH
MRLSLNTKELYNLLKRTPVGHSFVLFVYLFLSKSLLFSQGIDSTRAGIHQVESEYYSSRKSAGLKEGEKEISFPSNLIIKERNNLTGMVFGWHPYWVASSAYLSYDYNALSHIAYFSYEVDTSSGGYTSIHDWSTTPVISYAHQRGTKVVLTVTNFGTARNTELLSDTVKQKFLINTVISLLISRNGDGVNFDLESVALSQRNNLVDFIRRAVKMIKARLPASEISMATPAVDWSGSWDLLQLSQLSDYLIVMGYDYYWKGSATAGPVAPLEGESYNVTRTITTYLAAGVAPEKLLLGVPWYGYDWPVVTNTRKANASGTATARIYTAANQLAVANGKTFDLSTKVPWVSYGSSPSWRQLWFDDPQSLGMKYSLTKYKNLGGIGIWALSYEGGSSDMWGEIKSAFVDFDSSRNIIIKVYPNPTSQSSKIEFSLASAGFITLIIYDSQGKEREVLISESLDAGFHFKDFNPSRYGSGLFIAVLRKNNSVSTQKILVTTK